MPYGGFAHLWPGFHSGASTRGNLLRWGSCSVALATPTGSDCPGAPPEAAEPLRGRCCPDLACEWRVRLRAPGVGIRPGGAVQTVNVGRLLSRSRRTGRVHRMSHPSNMARRTTPTGSATYHTVSGDSVLKRSIPSYPPTGPSQVSCYGISLPTYNITMTRLIIGRSKYNIQAGPADISNRQPDEILLSAAPCDLVVIH